MPFGSILGGGGAFGGGQYKNLQNLIGRLRPGKKLDNFSRAARGGSPWGDMVSRYLGPQPGSSDERIQNAPSVQAEAGATDEQISQRSRRDIHLQNAAQGVRGVDLRPGGEEHAKRKAKVVAEAQTAYDSVGGLFGGSAQKQKWNPAGVEAAGEKVAAYAKKAMGGYRGDAGRTGDRVSEFFEGQGDIAKKVAGGLYGDDVVSKVTKKAKRARKKVSRWLKKIF